MNIVYFFNSFARRVVVTGVVKCCRMELIIKDRSEIIMTQGKDMSYL
jgi:hypothetical protein